MFGRIGAVEFSECERYSGSEFAKAMIGLLRVDSTSHLYEGKFPDKEKGRSVRIRKDRGEILLAVEDYVVISGSKRDQGIQSKSFEVTV